jgi:hypothetical protein
MLVILVNSWYTSGIHIDTAELWGPALHSVHQYRLLPLFSISPCFHLIPSVFALTVFYTNLIEGRCLIHIDTEGEMDGIKMRDMKMTKCIGKFNMIDPSFRIRLFSEYR